MYLELFLILGLKLISPSNQYLVQASTLEPSQVLEFMGYINKLKHTSRRGWVIYNIKNHERISGHMYAMAMMTFLLGDQSKLDRLKCLQLTLIHDLAEAIVGDITPLDNVSKNQKQELEFEAMKKITSNLGEAGDLIYNLFQEYEARETPEAKFVKDLDLLDLLYSTTYYETRDKSYKLQSFFDLAEPNIKDSFVVKLVEALKLSRVNQEDED